MISRAPLHMTPLLPLLLFALARAAWPDAAFCTELRGRTAQMFGEDVWYQEATPIQEGLWLGNVCAAVDWAFLAQYNITGIVNMAVEWAGLCVSGAPGQPANVTRACFALDDVTNADVQATLLLIKNAVAQVADWRAAGRAVLVHCNMGVSRSTAVVLAYLMRREAALLYSEAWARVRRLRPIAQPNALFEALLDTPAERKRRWKAKFEL